jgi:hypothetical protein
MIEDGIIGANGVVAQAHQFLNQLSIRCDDAYIIIIYQFINFIMHA